jgi:ATP-dependent helicase/nuclease subunit B
MASAGTGEGWAEPPEGVGTEALDGVRVIEAATVAEEAQAVALALRRALETPGRTAALVTPDRGLARRVAALMERWGISVDDSAGVPLTATPPGTLVLALAEALARGFSPVPLLALLKHPLVSPAGPEPAARAAWLGQVRALDLALRGVRPAAGLDGISARLDEVRADPRAGGPGMERLARWWSEVAAMLAPLEMGGRGLTLAGLADALVAAAGALAGERPWAGPAGRALAGRLEGLVAAGELFGVVGVADAPALLMALLGDISVRPPWSGHPRLAILGPVEAQLARADLMILGGLNEGVWPAVPAPDPWLAPAIRARLGLGGTARAMGLAAQDFVRGASAPRVLLTRARRDASGPMRASRLLLRLDALAARLNGKGLAQDAELLAMARGLDRPALVSPVGRPAPAPPAADRPRRLSVTAVDTLMADPFAFYARTMLRLPVLDPLDQDPGAAERGTLLHAVLEDWLKGGDLTMAALDRLVAAMLARQGGGNPLLRALWGPRAERALRWAGEQVIEGMALGRVPVAAEERGELRLDSDVVVTGIADRVDRMGDGFVIVDYKSGAPPQVRDVLERRANQLPLLALMLQAGGMGTLAGKVLGLEYWRLKGAAQVAGEVRQALGGHRAPLEEHLVAVKEEVTALTGGLLCGAAPFRPHVHPGLVWGDYDHLARVLEWRDRQ